jgi:hypothetical protein
MIRLRFRTRCSHVGCLNQMIDPGAEHARTCVWKYLLFFRGEPSLLIAQDPLSAETGHASVRVLAARVLAIGSKQKSAALRAGYSNVAQAATR